MWPMLLLKKIRSLLQVHTQGLLTFRSKRPGGKRIRRCREPKLGTAGEGGR